MLPATMSCEGWLLELEELEFWDSIVAWPNGSPEDVHSCRMYAGRKFSES